MQRFAPLLIAALAVVACARPIPAVPPGKPAHHAEDGFRNRYPHPEKAGFWEWKTEQWKLGLPKKPEEGYRFETVLPDQRTLRSNRRDATVTWVGHATLLVQIGGLNILTDPQFSDRASPVSFAGPRRVVPPVPALDKLPHIDAVVISHDHYDHLDLASVTALAEQAGGPPRFFAGLGMKQWFASAGIDNVEEMDWWQSVDYKGVQFNFVPVQHWSKRTLWDTNRRLWGGWALRHPSFSFFFAGDTGYSKDFADIGARFGGFDLAAIPVGAYAPRWFMSIMHVDPGEAVLIHRDVGARQSVGIHWGTFDDLTDESLYEPPKVLAREREKAGLKPEDFFLMKHGETRVLRRL